MATQEWYTAQEAAGLPGMPGTERGVRDKLKRERVRRRKRAGRGGGWEYHKSGFPKETQDYLLDAAIAALPEPSCPLPATSQALPPAELEALPAPATLARWQRDTMDARLTILALVDQLAQTVSLNKAIDRVVAQAKAELLPPHIQALIPVANARSGKGGGKRTLSRRTLFRWRELRTLGSTALAPTEARKKPVPPWAVYFLKCYQIPSKPSVPLALEETEKILPEGIDLPSESQARRFLSKMSAVEREKGRRSPKELKSIKLYRKRDTSDLVPLEVVQCDGHSFKARIAHPRHGKPFRPEVCAVIDAATRLVVGWSAGLAESAETVADALRHCISTGPDKERGGIPAIFYTDPGSGNKAKVNADPVFGRYARLGITFKTGIVGNSQARGLVERLQQSLWIRTAKLLPTYTGKDMDSSVEHKAYRLLMQDVRQRTNSGLLPSWGQFLDLCAQAVDDYNNRPHSALPKITDAGGRRRHMTPAEMWDLHIRNGWEPDTVDDQELADLFRPRIQVTTRRGTVRLFTNIYAHSELQHYNGEQVLVEYEPQDGRYVYVRDMDERLICKAGFESNKSRMYPVSATDAAMDKRADARRKRLEQKLIEVEEERRGVVEILREGETLVLGNNDEKVERLQQVRRQIEHEMQQTNVVEIPQDDGGRYRYWCQLERRVEAGESLTDREQRFYKGFARTDIFRSFREMEQELAIK